MALETVYCKRCPTKIEDGDILFYCDSGAFFFRNIKNEFLNMQDDIWVSDIALLEKQFSKADAFVAMDCLDRKYWESNQIQSTVVVVRKCKKTVEFIDEWLKYCSDERVVSLNPNVMGLNNDDTYIANREDQTALSLLCKKKGNRTAKGSISVWKGSRGIFAIKGDHFVNQRIQGKGKAVFDII